MKKLLICAFYFPPFVGPSEIIGSLRPAKFAKYLPDFGWQPYVLTARLPVERVMVEDPQIANVYRTNFLDFVRAFNRFIPSRYSDRIADIPIYSYQSSTDERVIHLLKRLVKDLFFWPDSRITWVIFGDAVDRGLEIIRREKIDVIFSTSPPATSHVLAGILSSKTGIPWVADFRDLWSQDEMFKRFWPFQRIEERMERRCMKRVASLISVSEPRSNALHEFHKKAVHTIPNGFDDDDYDFDIPVDHKFTVVYTGKVHEGYGDPAMLFDSVSELIMSGTIEKEDVEIVFWGNNARKYLIKKAVAAGLESTVRINPAVAHSEIVKIQKSAQILVLIYGHQDIAYPGKLSEYLGARRPILAIGKRGSVIDELLRYTGAGVLCSNADEIKDVIQRWYSEWRELGVVRSKSLDKRIEEYSRRELTRRLSTVLDEAIHEDL